MLNIVDEYTRECLAIKVARKLNSMDVIETLADLFLLRGVPAHVRSDQGPEFIAEAVKSWIGAVGAQTAYIERGSPWENGYVESFNGRLRDELLNGEIFTTLKEAQIVIEGWRQHYNRVRPHSSLGYKPPAPPAMLWPAEPRSSTMVAKPTCIRFEPGHRMGAGQNRTKQGEEANACLSHREREGDRRRLDPGICGGGARHREEAGRAATCRGAGTSTPSRARRPTLPAHRADRVPGPSPRSRPSRTIPTTGRTATGAEAGSVSNFYVIDDTDIAGTIPYLPKGPD